MTAWFPQSHSAIGLCEKKLNDVTSPRPSDTPLLQGEGPGVRFFNVFEFYSMTKEKRFGTKMKISKKTAEFAAELNKFSGAKIKNIDDLSILLQLSDSKEREKMFDDILFTSKYLNGLGKILQKNITAAANPEGNGKSVSAEEARKKIMDEFKANMKKLSEKIADYIKDTDAEIKNNFEEKYLALNQQSLQNLTTLIYDLSWIKVFINSNKD